jgi:hypothetical protein
LKKLTLDHALTPKVLQELNAQIVELLSDESFDESILLNLVQNRDVLIREYLISCEPVKQKTFASAELEVNGLLVAYVKNLSKASLKQLSNLVKGRKAVKKYK